MEFRTLIKAYGIRFDVLVNGRVKWGYTYCSWLGRVEVGGQHGPPCSAHLAEVCLAGREVQHRPYSHQPGLWGGAHGCCEYCSLLPISCPATCCSERHLPGRGHASGSWQVTMGTCKKGFWDFTLSQVPCGLRVGALHLV